MATYSLEEIRKTARSKDPRLSDTKKYPDSWIDSKIEHAFETAESGRQVFTNEEIIDLKPYIADGVNVLQLTMDEDVHKFYDIICTHPYEITGKVNNDNTLSVEIDIDALSNYYSDIAITCRYFYYPRIDFETIFMNPEVYHYFRHCLYVNIYGSLADKENETYHQAQVDRFIADGTFGLPNDFEFNVGLGNFDIRPRMI